VTGGTSTGYTVTSNQGFDTLARKRCFGPILLWVT
jgi:hypothetical protein